MRFLNSILLIILLLSIGKASMAQLGEGNPTLLEKADFSTSITLYPNPATEYIQIKVGSLNAHQVKLTLYNLIGNEVQVETEVVEEHELRIRVKELSTGYYLLAVRDTQVPFHGTYKFVKR